MDTFNCKNTEEQIGGCQPARVGGWRCGVGIMGEGSQKVHTSSYKMNESWGCNIQHGDHSEHTVLYT